MAIVKVRNKETGEIFEIDDTMVNPPQPQTPALPGRNRVENLIESRESTTLSDIGETATKLPGIEDLAIPAKRGMDLAGEVAKFGFERMEAAIANPALEIQRSMGTQAPIDSLFSSEVLNKRSLVDEFIQGITGKKLGQTGDLARVVGVPDLAASSLGLMTTIAAGNFLSQGRITAGINKMVAAGRKKLRVKKVKDIRKQQRFFKEKADQFVEGIDDAYTGIRGEFDNLYKKIGDNVIVGDDVVQMQDIAVRLPDRVITNLRKLGQIKGKDALGKGSRTVLDANINTAKTIKTELGRSIPKKVWNGVEQATAEQAKMIDDYHTLNDLIARNAGEGKELLLRLNAKFKSLSDFNTSLKPTLKTSKGITKTNIRKIHSEAMQGEFEAMRKFSNRFFKDGRQVLADVEKFNKQKKFSAAAKKVGIALGIGTGIERLLVRPMLRAIKDSSGGGSRSSSEF